VETGKLKDNSLHCCVQITTRSYFYRRSIMRRKNQMWRRKEGKVKGKCSIRIHRRFGVLRSAGRQLMQHDILYRLPNVITIVFEWRKCDIQSLPLLSNISSKSFHPWKFLPGLDLRQKKIRSISDSGIRHTLLYPIQLLICKTSASAGRIMFFTLQRQVPSSARGLPCLQNPEWPVKEPRELSHLRNHHSRGCWH
jgi:hypothetical protein